MKQKISIYFEKKEEENTNCITKDEEEEEEMKNERRRSYTILITLKCQNIMMGCCHLRDLSIKINV